MSSDFLGYGVNFTVKLKALLSERAFLPDTRSPSPPPANNSSKQVKKPKSTAGPVSDGLPKYVVRILINGEWLKSTELSADFEQEIQHNVTITTGEIAERICQSAVGIDILRVPAGVTLAPGANAYPTSAKGGSKPAKGVKAAGGKSAAAENVDQEAQYVIYSMKMSLASAAVGTTSFTKSWPKSQLSNYSTENTQETVVESLGIDISLDKPFLSEQLLKSLNPVLLSVPIIKSLPNDSYLPQLCNNVYTVIKFGDQEHRSTETMPHATDVPINHEVVLFSKTESELQTLRRNLLWQPLKVEVHDRDPQDASISSVLCAETEFYLTELLLGNPSIGNSVEANSNASSASLKRNGKLHPSRSTRVDPIAPVVLPPVVVEAPRTPATAEGKTRENKSRSKEKPVSSPVPQVPKDKKEQEPNETTVSETSPPITQKDINETASIASSARRSKARKIRPGLYGEADSTVKLIVQIARPIPRVAVDQELMCVAIMSSHSNYQFFDLMHAFLRDYKPVVQKEVNETQEQQPTTNTIASPKSNKNKAVSTPTTTVPTLPLTASTPTNEDRFSGFELTDGIVRFFIIEGLADHGMRDLMRVVTAYPSLSTDSVNLRQLYRHPTSVRDTQVIRIVCNPNYRYAARLYENMVIESEETKTLESQSSARSITSIPLNASPKNSARKQTADRTSNKTAESPKQPTEALQSDVEQPNDVSDNAEIQTNAGNALASIKRLRMKVDVESMFKDHRLYLNSDTDDKKRVVIETLVKLRQLSAVKYMRDIFDNRLLPTPQMVEYIETALCDSALFEFDVITRKREEEMLAKAAEQAANGQTIQLTTVTDLVNFIDSNLAVEGRPVPLSLLPAYSDIELQEFNKIWLQIPALNNGHILLLTQPPNALPSKPIMHIVHGVIAQLPISHELAGNTVAIFVTFWEEKTVVEIDSRNVQYEKLLASRKGHNDFITQNKKIIETLSLENTKFRDSLPQLRKANGLPIREEISDNVQQQTREVFVYSKQSLRDSKSGARKQSSPGKAPFVYPAPRTAKECNEHPQKPTEARIEELKSAWTDPSQIIQKIMAGRPEGIDPVGKRPEFKSIVAKSEHFEYLRFDPNTKRSIADPTYFKPDYESPEVLEMRLQEQHNKIFYKPAVPWIASTKPPSEIYTSSFTDDEYQPPDQREFWQNLSIATSKTKLPCVVGRLPRQSSKQKSRRLSDSERSSFSKHKPSIYRSNDRTGIGSAVYRKSAPPLSAHEQTRPVFAMSTRQSAALKITSGES